jgi:hypothetical protein
MLLAMIVLQNSSFVLVGRYTRAGVLRLIYTMSITSTICEVSKLILAAALEYYTTDGQFGSL